MEQRKARDMQRAKDPFYKLMAHPLAVVWAAVNTGGANEFDYFVVPLHHITPFSANAGGKPAAPWLCALVVVPSLTPKVFCAPLRSFQFDIAVQTPW